MKFDFDKYRCLYVMHCKTEEEAKDFCKVMHEAGRTWRSGDSYLTETYWSESFRGDGMYYNFNNGTYSDDRSDFLSPNLVYGILEWSDFMKNKKFTRDDIRVWDIVKRADGSTAIINLVHGTLVLQTRTGYRTVLESAYDLDLTCIRDKCGDIVAVRRVNNVCDLRYNVFEEELGCLVWEREEPVEEMTMEDVCKALGKRVKIVGRKR